MQGRLEDGLALQESSRYWCYGHLDEGEFTFGWKNHRKF